MIRIALGQVIVRVKHIKLFIERQNSTKSLGAYLCRLDHLVEEVRCYALQIARAILPYL